MENNVTKAEEKTPNVGDEKTNVTSSKEHQASNQGLKVVKLKHNNTVASFYLTDGHQSKESVEKCVKSLLHITDPFASIIGLLELTEGVAQEDGVLVPLELLEVTNSVIDPTKYYTPHFWTPQVSEGEGASDVLLQHFQNNEEIKVPAIINTDLPQKGSQETAAPQEPNWQYVPQQTEATTEEDFARIDQQWAQQHTQPAQPVPPQNATNIIHYDANDPWQNWEYFHQYGKLTIHNEMLKDEARTQTYLEAIKKNAPDLAGKVVMDLGTGTGILSFFCVSAGAAKVYAIEASDLADWTELIVASNGLSDKIKVIKGRIEDLTLPETVDVIVSEWMGTFLIFESMMESLLWARDRWLKPDGKMFPSHANIFLSPVTMDEFYKEKVEFWNNVYGVDMSIVIPFAKKCAFEKPMIDKAIKPECVLADPVLLNTFDLKEVPVQKPYEKTVVKFSFKANKDANMHGFVAWFDVSFLGSVNEKIVLSTSPFHKDTHWHQDLFLFDNPIAVKEGYTIQGTVRYQRNPDLLRHLIIDIAFGVLELPTERYSKRFYLWGNE